MSRLLKSQNYLMNYLGFVLLFGFISLGAIGGDLLAFESSPDDTNELKTLSTQVTSTAGLQPDEKCEAKKNVAAGKLAFCLQRAETLLVTTEGACSLTTTTDCYRDEDCPSDETCVKDEIPYLKEVDRCKERFLSKWANIQRKSEWQCPDGIANPNDLIDLMETYLHDAADALQGDTKLCSQLSRCTGNAGAVCGTEGDRCPQLGLTCYQIYHPVNDFCCCDS